MVVSTKAIKDRVAISHTSLRVACGVDGKIFAAAAAADRDARGGVEGRSILTGAVVVER